MRSHLVATAAATTLLALAMTGCGGDDPPKANAGPRIGPSSGPSAGGGATGGGGSEQQWRQCLQQRGIKFAVVDDKVDIDDAHAGNSKDQAAIESCSKFRPSQPERPSGEAVQAGVKMAQCLRRHGLQVKDPTASQPNLQIGPPGTPEEKIKSVSETCQKEIGAKS